MIDTRPTLSDRVRLRQKNESRIKRSLTSQLASRPSYATPNTRRRGRGRRSVRSSYAFSHEKGFGDLITTGTNMPGGKESGSVRLWPRKIKKRLENGTSLEGTFIVEEAPEKEMEEVKFAGVSDQVDGLAPPPKAPVQITSL